MFPSKFPSSSNQTNPQTKSTHKPNPNQTNRPINQTKPTQNQQHKTNNTNSQYPLKNSSKKTHTTIYSIDSDTDFHCTVQFEPSLKPPVIESLSEPTEMKRIRKRQPQTQSQAQTKSQTQTQSQAQPQTQTQAQSQTQSQTQSQAQAQTQSQSQSQQQQQQQQQSIMQDSTGQSASQIVPSTTRKPKSLSLVFSPRLAPKFTTANMAMLQSVSSSSVKTGWTQLKENKFFSLDARSIKLLSSVHGFKKAENYISDLKREPTIFVKEVQSPTVATQPVTIPSSVTPEPLVTTPSSVTIIEECNIKKIIKLTISSYHRGEDYRCLLGFDDSSNLRGAYCICGTGYTN